MYQQPVMMIARPPLKSFISDASCKIVYDQAQELELGNQVAKAEDNYLNLAKLAWVAQDWLALALSWYHLARLTDNQSLLQKGYYFSSAWHLVRSLSGEKCRALEPLLLADLSQWGQQYNPNCTPDNLASTYKGDALNSHFWLWQVQQWLQGQMIPCSYAVVGWDMTLGGALAFSFLVPEGTSLEHKSYLNKIGEQLVFNIFATGAQAYGYLSFPPNGFTNATTPHKGIFNQLGGPSSPLIWCGTPKELLAYQGGGQLEDTRLGMVLQFPLHLAGDSGLTTQYAELLKATNQKVVKETKHHKKHHQHLAIQSFTPLLQQLDQLLLSQNPYAPWVHFAKRFVQRFLQALAVYHQIEWKLSLDEMISVLAAKKILHPGSVDLLQRTLGAIDLLVQQLQSPEVLSNAVLHNRTGCRAGVIQIYSNLLVLKDTIQQFQQTEGKLCQWTTGKLGSPKTEALKVLKAQLGHMLSATPPQTHAPAPLVVDPLSPAPKTKYTWQSVVAQLKKMPAGFDLSRIAKLEQALERLTLDQAHLTQKVDNIEVRVDDLALELKKLKESLAASEKIFSQECNAKDPVLLFQQVVQYHLTQQLSIVPMVVEGNIDPTPGALEKIFQVMDILGGFVQVPAMVGPIIQGFAKAGLFITKEYKTHAYYEPLYKLLEQLPPVGQLIAVLAHRLSEVYRAQLTQLDLESARRCARTTSHFIFRGMSLLRLDKQPQLCEKPEQLLAALVICAMWPKQKTGLLQEEKLTNISAGVNWTTEGLLQRSGIKLIRDDDRYFDWEIDNKKLNECTKYQYRNLKQTEFDYYADQLELDKALKQDYALKRIRTSRLNHGLSTDNIPMVKAVTHLSEVVHANSDPGIVTSLDSSSPSAPASLHSLTPPVLPSMPMKPLPKIPPQAMFKAGNPAPAFQGASQTTTPSGQGVHPASHRLTSFGTH